MPETFSTPAGSPVVGFSGSVKAFTDGTPTPASGTGPVTFSTPAGSPTIGYSGQVRVH